MQVTLQVALVAAVVCLACCEPGAGAGAQGSRMARAKQPRATRGFKNTEMMTARGFGKRNYNSPRAEMFGLDNFWEMLESSQEHGQQEQTDDKVVDSIPVDWFVDEMLNNPEFTRTVVRKFLDVNQDGTLSPDELLRNVN